MLNPACLVPSGSKETYLPNKNLAKWHQDWNDSSQVRKGWGADWFWNEDLAWASEGALEPTAKSLRLL